MRRPRVIQRPAQIGRGLFGRDMHLRQQNPRFLDRKRGAHAGRNGPVSFRRNLQAIRRYVAAISRGLRFKTHPGPQMLSLQVQGDPAAVVLHQPIGYFIGTDFQVQ